LERLVEELDLNVLKTEHCYQLTKGVARYAKDKMKGRQVEINEYHGPVKQSEIPKFMRRNGHVSVLIKNFKSELKNNLPDGPSSTKSLQK